MLIFLMKGRPFAMYPISVRPISAGHGSRARGSSTFHAQQADVLAGPRTRIRRAIHHKRPGSDLSGKLRASVDIALKAIRLLALQGAIPEMVFVKYPSLIQRSVAPPREDP